MLLVVDAYFFVDKRERKAGAFRFADTVLRKKSLWPIKKPKPEVELNPDMKNVGSPRIPKGKKAARVRCAISSWHIQVYDGISRMSVEGRLYSHDVCLHPDFIRLKWTGKTIELDDIG